MTDRSPRAAALAAWQVRYAAALVLAQPAGGVLQPRVPAHVPRVFGTLNSGNTLDIRDPCRSSTSTPGDHGLGRPADRLQHHRDGLRLDPHEGILKRVRMTPMPWAAYVAGAIGSTLSCSPCRSSCCVVGVALFGAHLPVDTLPGLLATLVARRRRLHDARRRRVADRRQARERRGLLMVITLPLMFISNIWFPIDSAPAWVHDLAGAFPLQPLADGLPAAFDPSSAAPGSSGTTCSCSAIWTVIGCAMMGRTMLSFRAVPDAP